MSEMETDGTPSVKPLLAVWTIEQYLKTRPPCAVVTLTRNMTVGQALKLLATHEILSAPLFDDAGEYYGFLDTTDLLKFLLSIVNLSELLEEDTSYKLKQAGAGLEYQQLGAVHRGEDGALIYKAYSSSTLLEVVEYGFLHPNGSRKPCHRVAVFDVEDETDEEVLEASEVPTGIRVTSIISQTDIVQFAYKRVQELGPLRHQTLVELGLAYKTVVCVPAELSTVKSFACMLANQVSSVGVVSHERGGALVASLSASDLRGLLPQDFSALSLPVLEFLNSKASAAGYHNCKHAHANDWGLKGAEALKGVSIATCSPSSTFEEVIGQLSEGRLHRMYVVDANERPLGIVTLTDILKTLVTTSRQLLEES